MAWYSVLPSHLTVYETWAIRTFIILAVINMAPWMSLIIYDFLLYIFRTLIHEVPIYGGRARGETRPRAPSLVDRRRSMSVADMFTSGSTSPRASTDHLPRNRAANANRIDENAIEDGTSKS